MAVPVRVELVERLRARRAEIEQAVLTRVYAISDPTDPGDPAYLDGLRAAVTAAIDFGLEAIEQGEERSPPVPEALIAQARAAARGEVSLDTVLRRYFAGYALLGDILIEEAEQGNMTGRDELQRLLRVQAALFDRLLAEVSKEYSRTRSRHPVTVEQRRTQRVRRLLAGELIDAAGLGYDLDSWHLGAVASGLGTGKAIQAAAERIGCRLLLLQDDERAVWAWFGSRRPLAPVDLESSLDLSQLTGVTFAFGEPGKSLAGWRRTHRQAAVAFPVALRRPGAVAHYADVALVASIIRDDLLAASLHELYLEPLAQERDGGEVSRETLRAYFAANRNASSAATRLGVSRRTVANRLRAIEEKIGRLLDTTAVEIEAALRLEDLGETKSPTASTPGDRT